MHCAINELKVKGMIINMGNDKKILKPSILPGFMELLPSDQVLFNNMMNTIKRNYEKYGFTPIDTPLIEKSEILLAKGGGETEKQIYRFTKGDTDMALRFDLTVPLARYVAQHFSELTFPFRRYHIGKVYRGERNQRGRFREFYQCDIDIIGNGKLNIINDAEIPCVIYSTFKDLNVGPFTIRVNNRKVLNGFFEYLNIDDKAQVLRVIDKLDKIGEKAVFEELLKLGLCKEKAEKIINFIKIKGSSSEIIKALKDMDIDNDTFSQGTDELEKVIYYIKCFGVPEEYFAIDLTIARGLDYYTGTVYETVLNNYPSIGSVCSGGRYDNLAEYYTSQKLPGVGISIGFTRLFYQLKEAKIIGQSQAQTPVQVIVIPMDDSVTDYSIKVCSILRNQGISSQFYSEEGKIGKKFSYADKIGIPNAIVIGTDEFTKNKVTLKNMKKGEQHTVSIEDAVQMIKQNQVKL